MPIASNASSPLDGPAFRVHTHHDIGKLEQTRGLPEIERLAIKAVAQVLPFRVNSYVLDNLIDWGQVPDDPIFRLVFPQREMLAPGDFDEMFALVRRDASQTEIKACAERIRARLNPHPAGQMELNVPTLDDEPVEGLQHKYRETVLFFPSQGQVCHSYCSFCFRWAQFVGDKELRFAATDAERVAAYLRKHTEVSDLLVTGGDPMVMRTRVLKANLEPLLTPELEHVQTVRIGTKSLSFWPYRFVTDSDADELLEFLESIVDSGRHVALMAHYNHWRELDTPIAREAILRLRKAGVTIRSQGPLLRGINDSPGVWARMWKEQVRLGISPYYMFVERDTGPRHYFEVSLVRAHKIYRRALRDVSGLARTARGPSMSWTHGKVEVQGVVEVGGTKAFSLRFLQARNPEWVQRPFFARFDSEATWFDQLQPLRVEDRRFFDANLRADGPPAALRT